MNMSVKFNALLCGLLLACDAVGWTSFQARAQESSGKNGPSENDGANANKTLRGGPTIDNCDCGFFQPWCCIDDTLDKVDDVLDAITGSVRQ